jgi:hypothetical protein
MLFLFVAFISDYYSFTSSLSSAFVSLSLSLRQLLFSFLTFKCSRLLCTLSSLSPCSFSLSLSPSIGALSLSRFQFRLHGGFPFPALTSSPPTVSHSLPTECRLRSAVLTQRVWLSLFLFVAFISDCYSFTSSLSSAFVS